MSIDGSIILQANLSDRRTIGVNSSTVNIPANLTATGTFTDGSGALQANVLYQATLALSGGTYNLDLNGVLTDSYGSAVAMLRVKGIMVYNTGATSLTVGNGTNPWVTFLTGTGTLILPPSAAFAAYTPDATGWAVTASTGDILKFAGTGTAAFQVVILGASA